MSNWQYPQAGAIDQFCVSQLALFQPRLGMKFSLVEDLGSKRTN